MFFISIRPTKTSTHNAKKQAMTTLIEKVTPEYKQDDFLVRDVFDAEGNEQELWQIYRGDIAKGAKYYEITRPYRIWYEYLHLSPTFAIAQNYIRYERLSPEQEKKVPPDFFDLVVPTCRDMSFLLSTEGFDRWWSRHGADLFGKRILDYDFTNLMTVSDKSPVEANSIIQPFDDYLTHERLNNGNNGFVLLAVPFGMNKNKALNSFSTLLDDTEKLRSKNQQLKTYTLDGDKVHIATLSKNLRVLWLKGLKPQAKLWHLGLLTNHDTGHYSWLDPSIKKHTPKTKKDSESLASKTSNRINSAINTMENAIRGRFPCDSARDLPKINRRELINEVSHRLKDYVHWQQSGKLRHDRIEKMLKKKD